MAIKLKTVRKDWYRRAKGKTFVIAGALDFHSRTNVKQILEQLGAYVDNKINNNTDYLIIGINPGKKLEEAKELGIRVITDEQFSRGWARYKFDEVGNTKNDKRNKKTVLRKKPISTALKKKTEKIITKAKDQPTEKYADQFIIDLANAIEAGMDGDELSMIQITSKKKRNVLIKLFKQFRKKNDFFKSLYEPQFIKPMGQNNFAKYLDACKTGGHPYLVEGEKWPVCAQCDVPMTLQLQLNLNQISKDIKRDMGTGFFQSFLCHSDSLIPCFYYEPVRYSDDVDQRFNEESYNKYGQELIRHIDPISAPQVVMKQGHEKWHSQYSKSIFGKYKLLGYDIPTSHEHIIENLSPVFSDYYQLGNELESYFSMENYDEFQREYLNKRCKNKSTRENWWTRHNHLFGWTDWIQDPVYPECPRCGERMIFLYMYSDVVVSRIFQCQYHKDSFALYSDCD